MEQLDYFSLSISLVFLIESFLTLSWLPWYYRSGMVIFKKTIPLPSEEFISISQLRKYMEKGNGEYNFRAISNVEIVGRKVGRQRVVAQSRRLRQCCCNSEEEAKVELSDRDVVLPM